jgi:hypothetical protein
MQRRRLNKKNKSELPYQVCVIQKFTLSLMSDEDVKYLIFAFY